MGSVPVRTITQRRPSPSGFESPGYAQDPAVGSRIRGVLPEIGRQVAASLPTKPLAVMLTGSFARGEGSALITGKQLCSLSDMEFLVLCRDDSDLGIVQEALNHQARCLSKWLASRGIECELEFSAVDEHYLRRLRPHIFAYELLAHGRIVWGDEEVLASAPRFPASAIPRWDAWRMLNNRLLEQLQWAEVAAQRDPKWLESAFYHALKCYLDLATVVLIFEGQYRSCYVERAVAIKEWARAASREGVEFAGVLADRVVACTDFKLHPAPGAFPLGVHLDQNPRQLAAQVRTAMTELMMVTHQAWRWATINFVRLGAESRPDDEMLRKAVMRSQPLREKLRGWAKLALMPEVRSQRGFMRRMGRLLYKASPRYLIYCVASELYFHLPEAIAGASPEVREKEQWLPVCFAQHAAERRDWWRLRADVLSGWRLFLRNHWA